MSSRMVGTVAVVFVLCAAAAAHAQSQAAEPSHHAAANAPVATAAAPAAPSRPGQTSPVAVPAAPAAAHAHGCPMAAGHDELKALVAAMNDAAGPAKVEAIAAVVNALVAAHGSGCAMMSHGSHQSHQAESTPPVGPAPGGDHEHTK